MLTGKPDYVIKHDDGSLIPVEYKSAKAPNQPYESHIMQLAAYCALIESHFGTRPAYGIIRYSDRSFNIFPKRVENFNPSHWSSQAVSGLQRHLSLQKRDFFV